MEELMQALDLLRDAAEKARKARKMLEDAEILICGYGFGSYTVDSQVHIHKIDQLEKLAASIGIDPDDFVHPERIVYFNDELRIDDFVIGFEHDGVFYFALDPNYRESVTE